MIDSWETVHCSFDVKVFTTNLRCESLESNGFMGKAAASVLLKLFINGNERCHTIDLHLRETLFL